MVIPCLEFIVCKAEKTSPFSEEGRTLKAALVKEMRETFAVLRDNPAYLMATILDPRFKNAALSSSESGRAVDLLNSKLKTMETVKRSFIPVSI
jgi:hypothetical protein